jgi:hypothetical protein
MHAGLDIKGVKKANEEANKDHDKFFAFGKYASGQDV